jgi:hypothetical protein
MSAEIAGRLVEGNRVAGVDVAVQDQDRHGLEFLNAQIAARGGSD